ncbi:mRNA surveillance protein pelota [Candidatus Woesearchaeota archaeon]|nr:mRNA surveillance protein pelota [Candidatus Woesearchaeota archaeon]RLE42266.1 MAG: mRNA surveillance protein pelota [Candidatus Woesearchaeota archaeon]
MKVLMRDKDTVKLRVDNLNDLWHLSQIIEPGDIIKAKTERKIVLGDKQQRSRVKKITPTLSIEVERVEFHKYSDVLRVSGKIVEGPEDIPRGQYHTIDVKPGKIITLSKQVWLGLHFKRIKEAQRHPYRYLLLIMDRDEATFALLTPQGYQIISELRGEVEKKGYKEAKEVKFYSDIITKLNEYNERYSINKIIVASPAFWKEDLIKLIKNDELKSKIVLASCSHTGEQGIVEVLKRDELTQALKEDRVSREMRLVEELMAEIASEGNCAYGIAETRRAAEMGAIKLLILTDGLIKQKRQEGAYEPLHALLNLVQNSGGRIEIIESENPAGRKLDGLGGIAALLRFKLY